MPHQAVVDEPSVFDAYAFHKYMDRMGGAYRNRAIGLIRICLSFSKAAEQSFTQDAKLSEVLQVCDETLLEAAKVPTSRHPASDRDFERTIRKLLGYLSRHSSSNMPSTADFDNATQTLLTYGSRFHSSSDRINDVRECMRIAKEKDHRKQEQRNEDPSSKVIKFQIMRSPTDLQPISVKQLLNNDTKREEVLWNFFRFDGEKRLTLSQNPHFYCDLPTSPSHNWREVDIRPIEENWHSHNSKALHVLTNSSRRVFLELGPTPTIASRAFDNVWHMNNATLVFKSIGGGLEGESIVGAVIGDLHPRYHMEPPSSRPGVGATSPCMPVEGWNHALRGALLASPNIKIRIIGCSGCAP